MNKVKNKYPQQLTDSNSPHLKSEGIPAVFMEVDSPRDNYSDVTDRSGAVDFPPAENSSSLPGYVD
jgi:hypothetical protein